MLTSKKIHKEKEYSKRENPKEPTRRVKFEVPGELSSPPAPLLAHTGESSAASCGQCRSPAQLLILSAPLQL